MRAIVSLLRASATLICLSVAALIPLCSLRLFALSESSPRSPRTDLVSHFAPCVNLVYPVASRGRSSTLGRRGMSAGLVLGGFCSVPSRSCRVYGLRQFVHGVNVRALEELEDVDWPVDCVEDRRRLFGNPKLHLMELSLVSKAKSALQNVAAKAERVLTEIKADIKADFGRPLTLDGITRHSGKHKHDAEFPWSAKTDSERRYEDEFKRRILDLSKKPEDFLERPDNEHESVDMRTAMTLVGNVLEVDKVLKDLWFQYVPKKMKEQEFWRRYFIAVKRIRQDVINSDSDNSVGRSWSNIERRLTFVGIGNESLRKDPLEEEAYKEAFSVITVPPSVIVRRLAATIEVGRAVKSMQELASQGGGLLDRDLLSNNGDWSGIVASFAVMKRLSGGRDKDNKLRFSKTSSLGDYQTLLWSLFDADTQHEDREVRKFVLASGPKLPEEVHGAPPDSFVAQLAEIMAGIKTEQGMGEFWLEVIKELRRRWKEGQPISRMAIDEVPDLRYCLLHQQLQLINCCIARRKRRVADLASLEILNSCVAHEESTSPQSVSKCNDVFFRQENPIMTEDALREAEELILRTRSVGAGCSQLLSDMQAFKAANPGCILEDFVRWYSPLDWSEEPGSGLLLEGSEEIAGRVGAVRGYLSARMQSQGNLWQELWSSSRPVPAIKQSPLFDEELAGESTLDVLEDVAPSDLFEQLFLSALSAGFAIAEAAPVAKTEVLARCLRECSEYVVATCGRGMSTSKLDRLCEVYEVMESAIHSPPCDEPVEAPAITTAPIGTVVKSDDKCHLPDPVPIKEAENVSLRKSIDQPQAQQFVKADFGHLFSRIFEGKSSIFEKKHSRPFIADERPTPTVSGEWTFV
nr:uncharacterized protein LOC112273429 isoform X2 [Physcomitrium patens]|eukprot:XP_024357977.1 uncharacterized protein LOC112273429 isoform X2 [Physcomitrella patens]